jgi:hypothetical protein
VWDGSLFEEGSQLRGTGNGLEIRNTNLSPTNTDNFLVHRMTCRDCSGLPGTFGTVTTEELQSDGRLVLLKADRSPSRIPIWQDWKGFTVLSHRVHPFINWTEACRSTFSQYREALSLIRVRVLQEYEAGGHDAVLPVLQSLEIDGPLSLPDFHTLIEEFQTFPEDQRQSPEWQQRCREVVMTTSSLAAAQSKLEDTLAEHQYSIFDRDLLRIQLSAIRCEVCRAHETELESHPYFLRFLETQNPEGIVTESVRTFLEKNLSHLLPVSDGWLTSWSQSTPVQMVVPDSEQLIEDAVSYWLQHRRGKQLLLDEDFGFFLAKAIHDFPVETYELTPDNMQTVMNEMLASEGDAGYERYFSDSIQHTVREFNTYRRGDSPYADLLAADGFELENNIYSSCLSFAEKYARYTTIHSNRLNEFYQGYQEGRIPMERSTQIQQLLRRSLGKPEATFDEWTDVWNEHPHVFLEMYPEIEFSNRGVPLSRTA